MLNFRPYEIPQIVEIIKDRLSTLENNMSPRKDGDAGSLPIMDAQAIEFCARKIAGTGDVRRALDICRSDTHNNNPLYLISAEKRLKWSRQRRETRKSPATS